MTNAAQEPRFGGRFEDEGPGLRARTARGTIINSAFLVGLSGITFLRGFAVAAFLTASEFGVWGILAIAIGSLASLKEVGVADKFVQQDEDDQELAFQRAFTVDSLLNGVLLVLLAAATPFIAFIYGRPELVAPALLLLLGIPAASLQAPLWVFERRMQFGRARALAAVNPLVATVVTVALAAAGTGYWSLVVGTVAGGWAGGIAGAIASPYRLRFRFARGTVRSYWRFSWPLFIDRSTSLVVAQATILVAESSLGLAAAGAVALASSIALFADRVDGIVTGAVYPAICAVQDRRDLLEEAFVKSNRLAIMWGIPFGVALALFAADLVDHVLGEKWQIAVGLMQAFGLIAAVRQIGFNWDAFYRARADTRPIAVLNLVLMLVFLAAAIPGLLLFELPGYAWGMAAVAAVDLLLRGIYLLRLFPGFRMTRHIARAVAPTLPAAAAVLLVRVLGDYGRSPEAAVAELALYVAVTALATWLLERQLLTEMMGYLRGLERRRQPV